MTPQKRIPGVWVPSSVDTMFDPSVQRVGPMAELIFRRGNEHSKRLGRDGELFTGDLPLIAIGVPGNPTKHAAALVREGLWEVTVDGWRIRSWLTWNLTVDEAKDRADTRRKSSKLGNHKRWHEREGGWDESCEHCNPGASVRDLRAN